MLKLPLNLISRLFNILEDYTLIDIHLKDTYSLIGICLVKLNKKDYIFNGLYLFIIDKFNCMPIYKYYIGNPESVYINIFNTDGILLNYSDHLNHYISLERFSVYFHMSAPGNSYRIYVQKVVNTYILINLLSSASHYSRIKHFKSNQNTNTSKLNEMCNKLYNDLKELEENYLLEYIEEI